MSERFLNGFLSEFIEENPMDGFLFRLDGLGDMPGDSLALAVRVRSQVDGIGLGRRCRQFIDNLLLFPDHLVVGLKIPGNVYSQLIPGQVFDVADRGLDHKVPSQIPPEGPGLGGRFDNQQRLRHAVILCLRKIYRAAARLLLSIPVPTG